MRQRNGLTVAATELRDIPLDLLDIAASAARRTCTHHGQVVPTIIRESDEVMAMRRTRAACERPAPTERRIEQQRWTPEVGEIERIKREVADQS